MSDEIKKQATILYNLYDTGINSIAEWYKQFPAMQRTKEYLGWIKTTMDDSPPEISVATDEELLDFLGKAAEGAAVLGSIPRPTPEFYPMVTTSGSVLPNVYNRYVRQMGYQFSSHPDVVKWAGITVAFGEELQAKQNRSEIVRQRLALLHPVLEQLHKEAIDLSFKAQAEADTRPVGASMTLTRLLDQFKGVLLDRCRGGKGANYDRISDYLAANSALTKTAVKKGEATDKALIAELLEIRKKMHASSGNRIVEILREVEEQIIIITDALDSVKLGISFS